MGRSRRRQWRGCRTVQPSSIVSCYQVTGTRKCLPFAPAAARIREGQGGGARAAAELCNQLWHSTGDSGGAVGSATPRRRRRIRTPHRLIHPHDLRPSRLQRIPGRQPAATAASFSRWRQRRRRRVRGPRRRWRERRRRVPRAAARQLRWRQRRRQRPRRRRNLLAPGHPAHRQLPQQRRRQRNQRRHGGCGGGAAAPGVSGQLGRGLGDRRRTHRQRDVGCAQLCATSS